MVTLFLILRLSQSFNCWGYTASNSIWRYEQWSRIFNLPRHSLNSPTENKNNLLEQLVTSPTVEEYSHAQIQSITAKPIYSIVLLFWGNNILLTKFSKHAAMINAAIFEQLTLTFWILDSNAKRHLTSFCHTTLLYWHQFSKIPVCLCSQLTITTPLHFSSGRHAPSES
jgi:hypothetical protein